VLRDLPQTGESGFHSASTNSLPSLGQSIGTGCASLHGFESTLAGIDSGVVSSWTGGFPASRR